MEEATPGARGALAPSSSRKEGYLDPSVVSIVAPCDVLSLASPHAADCGRWVVLKHPCRDALQGRGSAPVMKERPVLAQGTQVWQMHELNQGIEEGPPQAKNGWWADIDGDEDGRMSSSEKGNREL